MGFGTHSLVDLLRSRVAEHPESVPYTFLDGDAVSSYRYRDLDARARSIAAALRDGCVTGDRVVLVLPPGLDYVAAFFGCLYAGVIAVPVYPPYGTNVTRSLTRLASIVADAAPVAALTLGAVADQAAELAEANPEFRALRWLGVDRIPDAEHEPVGAGEEDLAFLQYTSGSTAMPKGVMVSHGNLLANCGDIERFFGLSPESKTVIWLPPYHDMGLIGGILQPMYTGYPTVLMSPAEFAAQPLRWLRAIAEHGATTSGGPNFAYELCVRKIRPEQVAELDLSRWRLAFNGAEPIRAEAMDSFARLLAPTGFRKQAFYPCYGLAEGTLIVSGGRPDAAPVVLDTDRGRPRRLVGCGQAAPTQRIAVVDQDTRRPCPNGTVGEIWVSGPSVATGYWGQLEKSAEVFSAWLADRDDGPYLRTGDLGFLDDDGELYVTGRIKDLIIQRGANHYPQDIEHTVTHAHPALRPNGGACFTVPVDGEERLVVAHELARDAGEVDVTALADAVRRAVADEHLITVHTVLLVRPGRLPRTSSGKIQRHATRDGHLGGTLDLVGCRDFGAATLDDVDRADETSAEGFVLATVARLLGVAPAAVAFDRSGPALGLDSMALLEVRHAVQDRFGVVVPQEVLYDGTMTDLVATVSSAVGHAPAPAPWAGRADRLSHGQRGLWFLDQLTGCGAAYNLAGAVRLPSDMDVQVLTAALNAVVSRHAALRTTFPNLDGEPVRQVHEDAWIALDIRPLADVTLDAELGEAAEEPFDLTVGPLVRAHLWTAPEQEPVLLLVLHHLVGDFWSMALVVDELARHCAAGGVADLPPAGDYADFVHWQLMHLDAPAGHASAGYWRARLSGELPVLELPTTRSRPPVQTFHGAAHPFTVDGGTAAAVASLARASGTTPHAVLLCAFHVLLHRYTGQTDILVATPTSGRAQSSFTDTVGYFVNPVVRRGNLADNPTFGALLARCAADIADSRAHEDFPFGLLTGLVGATRDPARSPVFQAMFVHHQAPSRFPPALGAWATGHAGDPFTVAGLRLTPVAVPHRAAQFDLTMVLAQEDAGLVGSVQYNSDLFDAAAIADLAENFRTLLLGAVTNTDVPVGALPLLGAEKLDVMLHGWNDTARTFSTEVTVSEAFATVAEAQPDAVAVVHGTTSLSYGELADRARELAWQLAAAGIGPESRVGVCVDRSAELVVALLGILGAGAAYVPLDPGHPRERLDVVLADARLDAIVTRSALRTRLPDIGATIVDLDERARSGTLKREPRPAVADNTAYVLYTSGSTGVPKGVVVSHRNVANFFGAMDERIGCAPDDTMLALTGVGFDISVLELLWTLTRGAKVVVAGDGALGRSAAPQSRHLDFSLFYFASADSAVARNDDRYRLILDGARFADRHGFAAVWTPERHFHEFGGLYPNPSVLSAAIAAVTTSVAVRAGSVVLPLHSPVRVAEEWSLVDNLSHGRAGVAFASGWHADDFVFFPENYADRKDRMFADLQTVHRLWRGETVSLPGGSGTPVDVRVLPRPVQPELPTWITAAGNPDTFVRAGEIGANVLTHLLGQTVEQVADNVRRYRAARHEHGHDPDAGVVTLMLHTYIGDDLATVRETVRGPFTEYLRSSVGLIENLVRTLDLPVDLAGMSDTDRDDLLAFAVDRYFDTSALFGTPESVFPLLARCAAAGVNEIACLVDFGLPTEVALAGLPALDVVRSRSAERAAVGSTPALATLIARHRPTLMQATPSTMRLVTLDEPAMAGLGSLRVLLLGGEALPPDLAETVRAALPARLLNMYGPTETTIWSAAHEVEDVDGAVPIGAPIANTAIHVVDRDLRPVPVGVPGELLIGGAGLARGYWLRPDLTAELFVPDPYSGVPGARLYRTGDIARRRADGVLEFLGRVDRQVKVNGVRIELGDVEAALGRLPGVREAAVVPHGDDTDRRLIAYVVSHGATAPGQEELRTALRERLPGAMVPSAFVLLPELPRTANGKLDVAAMAALALPGTGGARTPPSTELERRIATVWREVLGVAEVGRYDNFFDLGGHSISMVQVHSRLRTEVKGDLPLIKLLEHPTVSSLAAFLGTSATGAGTFANSVARARRQRDSRRRRTAPGRKDAT
jgi:natural product biosynthesis luciferase-like monooxygenase protein